MRLLYNKIADDLQYIHPIGEAGEQIIGPHQQLQHVHPGRERILRVPESRDCVENLRGKYQGK